MKTSTAIAMAALLSGCASIDSHSDPVAGWPNLTPVEHHVPNAEMRDRCGIYLPVWSSPEGCAIFRFDANECHIYVSADFPRPDVLEHERQHCEGRDHVGSTDMKAMLNDWKARQ